MIVTRIKYNGSTVRLGGFGPQKYQMYQLGRVAVQVVKNRVARGVGSDDSPMKPLSGRTSAVRKDGRFVRQRAGYSDWKAAHGLKSIRDLWGPGLNGGHMLDNFTVRYADERQVRMDITSRWGRIKARANERRSPWFGFSAQDTVAIYGVARVMFKGIVVDIAAKIRGVRVRPIWLDPLGSQDSAALKAA